jgi:hypothetical protein
MGNVTNYDPLIWDYNKFGEKEDLSDQCENKTCRCEDSCLIDDMMCYESMLLMEHKRKMRGHHKGLNGEE